MQRLFFKTAFYTFPFSCWTTVWHPKIHSLFEMGIFKILPQDVANEPIEPLAMAAIYDCRWHSSWSSSVRPHRCVFIKKWKDQTHNLNFEVVSTESARWTTWWLWKGLWSGSKRTLPSMCSRLNRGSRTPEVPCINITNSKVSTHIWSSHHFNVVWHDWCEIDVDIWIQRFVMILKQQMFAHLTTERIRNSMFQLHQPLWWTLLLTNIIPVF